MRQHETFDINLRDQAQENVLMQYQADDNFMAWIDAIVKPLEYLKRILLDVNRIFNIDDAEGYWLDKIGKLLLVNRRFCVMRLTQAATPQFAFNDSTFPAKYGYWNDDSVFGFWSDYPSLVPNDVYAQVCTTLDDVHYRKLIKAKIAKMYSRSTFEDILTAIRNIVGHDNFYLAEMPNGESMTLGLVFNTPLSQFDRDLFLYSNVAPRPAATRYDFLRELPNGKVFAFDDTTWTKFSHGFWNDDSNVGYWIY